MTSIRDLERAVQGARLALGNVEQRLAQCGGRKARAERLVAEANERSDFSRIAAELAAVQVLDRLAPELVRQRAEALAAVEAAEAALEQARARVAELERAAEPPPKVVAAAAELAALRGR